MPVKVLHVVRQYAPGKGGIETFVGQLVEQTRARGIESTVVTLDRLFTDRERHLESESLVEGTRVLRIPFTGSSRYPIAPRVLAAIPGHDLIHIHGVDFFADFLAATQPLHRTPMVLSTHGGFFHTSFARNLKEYYFRHITARSMQAMERVLACSISDEEKFREICDKVQLVENAVDTASLAAVERQMEPGLLLVLGRLTAHKRIELLIDALPRLLERAPHARLVVAGRDWEGLLPALRARAEAAGVIGKVDFRGEVSDVERVALLSRAQFLLSASAYEGFGISAVEAMAAGLPAVLQPIPSFRRIAHEGQAGTLLDFQAGDVAAHTLGDLLLEEPEAYERRCVLARAAAAPFSWDSAARTFEQAYYEAAGNRQRRLFGVKLEVTTRAEFAQHVEESIRERQPLHIAFANAHTLNLARADEGFRACLNRMYVLNDGAGVSLASYALYGRDFPQNLNGTDLVPFLLSEASQPLRLFLLGSRPGVAEAAARTIAERYPQHEIVGCTHGFFGQEEETDLLASINAARPDVLLVGMGNPVQERWIERVAPQLEVPVKLGVGALLDFLAGEVVRAPRFVQALRMEWAFRLFQEPRRLWRRYLVGNASFLCGLAGRSARMLPQELVPMHSLALTSHVPRVASRNAGAPHNVS